MSASPARGQLIVISGPSGVGKSTITKALVRRLNAALSISMTTRPKSAQETDGEDYFFVSEQRFRQAIDENELIEWALVFGNYYGTPRAQVEKYLKSGRHVVLEIDVAGAKQIFGNFPKSLQIFIMPPSEQELLQRLRRRGRDTEQVIQRRFAEAQREMNEARDSGVYQHFVINQHLDEAIEEAYRLICNHIRQQQA